MWKTTPGFHTTSMKTTAVMPARFTYKKNMATDGDLGEIVVRVHSVDSLQIQVWAQTLGVPYAGQTLGTFTQLVIDALLARRVRRYLGEAEKQQILNEQKHNCNECGDKVGSDAQFDHIIPLNQMMRAQVRETFQVLCGQCHADKTKKEPRPTVDKMMSKFTKRVWAVYMASPKPPPMAFKDEGAEEFPCNGTEARKKIQKHLAVDVVRCQYRALYDAEYIPIFTAMDDIVEV